MSELHEDLPVQGQHRAPEAPHESGHEVRAEPGPDSKAASPYRVYRNAQTGQRRIAARAQAGEAEGYTEVGQYGSEAEALEALGEDSPEIRYIVLENTATGTVQYTPETGLSTGWSGGGQFDQVTVFGSEAEAAAYVEQRRRR